MHMQRRKEWFAVAVSVFPVPPEAGKWEEEAEASY